MTWQPETEQLRQLAQFLRDSLSGRDQNVQKNAELMLASAQNSPDFMNYLSYLFSEAQPPAVISMPADAYFVARSGAAIMLKNNIKSSYKSIPDVNKAYFRSVAMQALQDTNVQIRNFAGNIITELVRQGGIMAWPQLLPELVALIENKTGAIPQRTQEGALSALVKICEDNKRALDRDYQGERPLGFLFPKLLDFTALANPIIRANALAAIGIFLPEKSSVVYSHLEDLLLHLFRLASDTSPEVRKYVCRAFTRIAEISPEKIAPHMAGLVDYTISQQQQIEEPELAIDAAEFWLCVAEDDHLSECLAPFLSKIVPLLLDSMVYDEDEVFRLESEQEDAEQEDREQDIKPVHATNKGSRLGSTLNGDAHTLKPNPELVLDDENLSDGEIEESDDEDDGDDPEDQWNLRKCSAAALDVLASQFHQPVFEVTLPWLRDNLKNSEWPKREAAVLAIGAIAEGCMEVVQPHLPELTQYFLSLLQDNVAVVRQITCWALGRYSSWPVQMDESGRQQYLLPVMDALLGRMLDRNKRVQEAAASAFANLEEKAKGQLQPYCPVIVQRFVECFSIYKDRNMYILYDCVQTLAEHVGPSLRDPAMVDLLMPALLHRWSRLTEQSRETLPLVECLSYVAVALSTSFTPYAKPIFNRCVGMIHQNLEDTFRAVNNPGLERPDKDFLVTSLDLLSGIIQALDMSKSAELVAASQPNLFQLLVFCMKSPHNDVRQSAYAVLGDCAIYVFDQLQPILPELMQLVLDQLEVSQINYDAEETGYGVINNACWSLGEIAMRHGSGMADYVDSLLEKLATILFSDKVPPSLNENAAIALGRLGTACPDKFAPHLEMIAPPWIRAISRVGWTDEKAHAMLGFNKVVMLNPQAMEKCLLEFFNEISLAPTEFLRLGQDRVVSFNQLFVQYKNMIPDFEAFLHNLPADRQQALRHNFNL
ncbi:ARM repeat-containing protein [Trichodelitschia bisporula]|uniref:ARM repeat-containing protein n=1 Tax=Trichodelitschia bisporula TaxID=703511 RepID=A0A6G1HK55_9PEZI|nr:ARM repeat-containing protein [Trichodelitschia bisporula]